MVAKEIIWSDEGKMTFSHFLISWLPLKLKIFVAGIMVARPKSCLL